ncbi:hypothetical protein ABS768_17025 [Flavobacterium sp. ST-75]|uniref:Uncharacterized protein n=1 Tax=Flavobacterium rhizophilum TaxID=3163296 RepID=A0ABW8YIB9_9FLAO
MKNSKYTKYIALFVIIILTALVYIDSFEDIEEICSDKPGKTEYYLINYAFKSDFREMVTQHNKSVKMGEGKSGRVYLKHNILDPGDPIFNDRLNYKKDGCSDIDIMDVYCIIDFNTTNEGEIRVMYNFLDDDQTIHEVIKK